MVKNTNGSTHDDFIRVVLIKSCFSIIQKGFSMVDSVA